MAYAQQELSFSLFVNDKQGVENRPDFTGSVKVAGIEYRMSAWKKESSAGKKYLSGKLSLPTAKPKEQTTEEKLGDSIEF